MTKYGLFLVALRNVKSFPVRVVPGHRRVAGRIHFREFTTSQNITLQPKSVLFLILMFYCATVATNCESNLCIHTQAVGRAALTSETWSK